MPPRPPARTDAHDVRVRQDLLDLEDKVGESAADDVFGDAGAAPLFTGLFGEIPGSDTTPIRLPSDTAEPERPTNRFVDPLG